VHPLPAGTPSGGGLLGKARAIFATGQGILAARKLLRRKRPTAVVGFGGYPSVPAVYAATMLGIPTIIHEQNAVLGRANKALAGRVNAIATGFAEVRGIAGDMAGKRRHVGNPVRPAVVAASATPFAPLAAGGTVRLLVFGGSQGARIMADIVPPALELLPQSARRRIALVQQAREEDLARVGAFYGRIGIVAELQPFFTDLPARMAHAHLVVSRSGASTVAELAVIGRPALLVPLPGAIDQDQAANAAMLASIGAASVILQPDFTPARLAEEITLRLNEPETLTLAASQAKSAGIADAADRLAAFVLETAELRNNQQTGAAT
jgi:UDP-N-acetylglucosamine--N-acetylmuramyl-(pentapeptide) pyrophosphoryl-undecaprenol N-acetylglucosamine transferase